MKQHLQCSAKKRSIICVQIHTPPFLTCSVLRRLHCLGCIHLSSGQSSRWEALSGLWGQQDNEVGSLPPRAAPPQAIFFQVLVIASPPTPLSEVLEHPQLPAQVFNLTSSSCF